jgi:type IV secretory pathway VirB3-like protein
MPERVLRAVAVPPTIFWAPLIPAVLNVSFWAIAMLFSLAAFQISPLRYIVLLFVCHILIAGQAARNPHLSTLLLCWARTISPTKNLPRKARVKRYAP